MTMIACRQINYLAHCLIHLSREDVQYVLSNWTGRVLDISISVWSSTSDDEGTPSQVHAYTSGRVRVPRLPDLPNASAELQAEWADERAAAVARVREALDAADRTMASREDAGLVAVVLP